MKTAAVTAGAALAGPAIARKRRPNFLFVLVDQERFPMHSDPVGRPHRERLKGSAVEFTEHHCVYPLCSPSRANLLTGLYPHQVGVHGNIYDDNRISSLDPLVPNMGNVFRQEGYATGWYGKWHLSKNVTDHGTLEYYGFSGGISNQKVAKISDRLVAENAAGFVRHHAGGGPWLLACSLINPHDICYPNYNPIYKDRGITAETPPNLETDLSDKPFAIKNHDNQDAGRYRYVNGRWETNLAYYYDLIMHADESLGIMLDAIEESGQWEDTVVIFTSDHGEMGGSHGLLNKGFIYEEAVRVPFWISAPGSVDGFERRPGLQSHIDLLPTMAGLAGIKWPSQLPGRDLFAKDGAPADTIFMEGGYKDLTNNAPWRGVRHGDWKYAMYLNGDEQLFNIAEDPLEMNDLSDDREAAGDKRRLKVMVNDWRRSTNDPLRGDFHWG